MIDLIVPKWEEESKCVFWIADIFGPNKLGEKNYAMMAYDLWKQVLLK